MVLPAATGGSKALLRGAALPGREPLKLVSRPLPQPADAGLIAAGLEPVPAAWFGSRRADGRRTRRDLAALRSTRRNCGATFATQIRETYDFTRGSRSRCANMRRRIICSAPRHAGSARPAFNRIEAGPQSTDFRTLRQRSILLSMTQAEALVTG